MSLKMWELYFSGRQKIKDFMKKEKGGSEIIAMVLIIAIVLVLAGIFWDKLKIFFDKLWGEVTGKDPTGTIKK